MVNERMKGHIFALISIIIWSIAFVSVKILLTSFSTMEILIVRFVLAYIFMLVIHPHFIKIELIREIKFAIAGCFGICLYFLLEVIALNYSSVANVSLLVSIAPLFTLIFSHYIFKTPIVFKDLIRFIITLIGLACIITNGEFNFDLNFKGDVLAILSAICWGIYTIIIVKIMDYKLNGILVTRRIFFYGIICMIPFTQFMEFNLTLDKFLNVNYIIHFLIMSLGASALSFSLWNKATDSLGTVIVNRYIYLTPIFAAFEAWIILGEKITVFTIIGTIFILTGTSELNLKKSRKE